MERALRQTIVIGPGGRGEIPETDLIPGTTAEIVVLFPETSPKPSSPIDRAAVLKEMEELRNKAIAEGMELWDIDRINAEVHERRYGDRERCS